MHGGNRGSLGTQGRHACGAEVTKFLTRAYLFVRKPQLVFEDGLSIRKNLNLVGKLVESLGQRLR